MRPNISAIKEDTDTVFHGGELERKETSSVMLQCTANGLPRPSIQWLRNGAILLGDEANLVVTSESIESDNGDSILNRTSVLQISKLQLSDDAEYACRAVNGFVAPIIGQNVWEFRLVVKG